MPKSRARVPMGDWTGGVNEDDAPGSLAATDLRIGRNVYWKGRALSARNGYVRQQTTAINSGAVGNGIFELVRTQGSARDILAVFGNKMYKDAKALTPTDITGAVTITAGQNNLVGFTHFNDLAIMCNGVDNPWQWNGSGNISALGGTPPVFNTMLAKWNRVFGAGHAAAPRTVRFTAIGAPETWTASNTVAAILGDASSAIEGRDYINQLGHLGDSIFVGLQNSSGRILYTGDSTTPFRYNQLSEFGIEGQTYIAVGALGYFLSQRGVHRIQPSDVLITYESSEISGRRLRTTWSSLNKNRIKYARPALYRTTEGNLLVLWPLTTGSGSTHDIVLMMDITDGPGTERFTWWTGWSINALGVVENASTRAEELLFADSAGFVSLADSGTDDNDGAYVSIAATRWEDFGSPSEKKNLRDMYLEIKQAGTHNLTIETFFDYATTPGQRLTQTVSGAAQAAWGTFVWGTDLWPTLGFVRNYLLGVDDGVVMSFQFSTSGANQPWSIYKFVPAVEAVGEALESS